MWRYKELIDNALDAAETAGVAPDIAIEFTESEHGLTLTISDNGPGIPADVVARIVGNFSSSTSDKAAYRAPLRGAQGNALKTVIGMPVACGAERSRPCHCRCGRSARFGSLALADRRCALPASSITG